VAFALAQQFANETIDEIEKKIIDRAFQDLGDYTKLVFEDINSVLNKIEQLEDKLICTEVSVIDQILEAIKVEFGLAWWIVDPWDPCRIQVSQLFPDDKLLYKFFSEYTYNQLYYYTKCSYLNPLSPNSTILEIRESYRDWEYLAAHMRCGATAVDDQDDVIFYLQEMGEASRRYHIWDSTFRKEPLNNKHKVRGKNYPTKTDTKPARKPIVRQRLQGSNCTTPIQCYEEAYNMLKQAQADIQHYKDLAVIANNTANSALKAAGSAGASANSAVSSANSAVSTANSAVSVANSAVGSANSVNQRVSTGPRNCREANSGFPSDSKGELCELDRNTIACNPGEVLVNLKAVNDNQCNGRLGYVWQCCSW